jgi:SpoVK/Ycf46/Vps4 family AAA+-type ATPase
MRKGRFDEIFFVDLPSFIERKEIFRVHLLKRKMNPETYDLDILSQASVGYSGAEIEEAIISAMFDAFYEKGKLSTERITASLKQTVPLSKTMSEEIDKLRNWAEGRARPATSAEIAKEPGPGKRKLEI